MHQHHILLTYFRQPCRHVFRNYHTSNNVVSSSSVVSSINWVRDRALDHAVEKERDLKPMINIKNLILSEPSKSLPLTTISDNRHSLGLLNRPIDFIRKYPSVFNEYLPTGIAKGVLPHVKLTPDVISLDSEETILFERDDQKIDVANRLLKLLMLARVNRIPLSVIDKMKWDLGLPDDYTRIVVPHFPDYFVVSGSELELVCWSDELAVSVMEKNEMSAFPVGYSRGFEVDKKFKKWVDDWQKLPYVSPYENVLSSLDKSDESDKWIVGLLHEVLHLLVPKKTDKENLLFLGEYLGVRSRFKKVLLQHPGIFYVSSKLHTHTVVLREAYKRDLLVAKPQHPVMTLRSSYLHLMNMVKEKNKSKNADVVEKKKKAAQDLSEGEDEEFTETESEEEEDDSEVEGVDDSDSDIDDIKSDKENMGVNENTATKRKTFEGKNISGQRGRREDYENGNTKIRGRSSRSAKFHDSPRRNTPNSRGSENDGRRRGSGRSRKNRFDENTESRNNQMSDSKGTRETNSPRYLRTEVPGAHKGRERTSERSNASRTRDVSRTREGRF